MTDILVVRFGSLGDLCLLAWSLGSLARATAHGGGPPREVALVTKAAFAPLLARVPGVVRVEALPDGGLDDLARLARRLRPLRARVVVDAHGVLRSRLLLAMLGRRPRRRLAKHTAARLALLWLRRRPPALRLTMRDRFDALLTDLLPGCRLDPRPRPPLAGLAAPRGDEGARPRLGIAPGARWDPKRWPEARFAALLRAFRAASDAPVSVFLGPREETWYDGGELARTVAALPDVATVRGRDLVDLAGDLSACDVLVTNDSGLMHLAEATGTPVVALFGPTVREFGYAPTLPRSRLLEVPLFCRPCSRNGRRACWRRDHACLRRIDVERVLSEVLALRSWPAPGGAPPPCGEGDRA